MRVSRVEELTVTAHDTRDTSLDTAQERMRVNFMLGPVVHVGRFLGTSVLLLTVAKVSARRGTGIRKLTY